MLREVPPRTRFPAAVVCATCLAAGRGHTQPAVETRVQPPVLTKNAVVSYPPEALAEKYFRETTVVLVLEVDRSGVVTQATPESPAGHGFDEAATSAALALKFTPAMRAGKPLAARVRFRFVFRPPPAQLVGRVTTPDGQPLRARVSVTLPDATVRHVRSEADGHWSLKDLGRGVVTVTVHAQGQRDDTSRATLEHGQETSVVIRLEPLPADPKPSEAFKKDDDAVEEVEVQGTKPPREVTKRTLTREEIDKIPGTNGDALRSIQSLPGVARPPLIGGFLMVRGSSPVETTTFVDGTPIPIVYHFGGLSSVVPTEVLDRLDFYPGNYGATYGRGTAGMVDVTLRDPRKEFHGFAQADLIDLRLMVEGPIGKTGWTFLAAGRRSWFDVWLIPVLEETGAGISTAPRYYDYQLMVQRNFGRRASFRTTFFGSDDALAVTRSKADSSEAAFGGGFDNKTRFYRIQSIYRNEVSEGTALRVVAATGRDQDDISAGGYFISTTEYPSSLRAELSQKIIPGLRANLGVDLIYAPYDLSLRLPPRLQPDLPPGNLPPGAQPVSTAASGQRGFAGGYAELEVVPWVGGRIVPGIRADYASTTRTWDASPRLNLRHDLVSGIPRTTVKGGVGLYHQPPTALESDPTYGQKGLKSNRAVHYAAGFEEQFSEHLDLSVELFAKSLDRLVVSGQRNSGEGRAWGSETLLRFRGHPRYFGWIAYTLSRSERRDSSSESWRLFQYDQTHDLTVVGSYDLGRGYRLGGRFRLVSGSLYTPNVGGGFDASAGSYHPASEEPPFGSRLPLFHQLDLRLDKTWAFAGWKLTAYADVQNVYNHRAIEQVDYNYNYTTSTYARGLPILPSIGLRGEI